MNSYSTTLAAACHWSFVARRGTQLSLRDPEGGANLAMLLYNPTQLTEKYNAPDTLKCQHTFKLTRGHCLYSDMGRIFCSIIEDSFGWHDTVCGNSHAHHIRERWGERDYQRDRNRWHQNGYDSFLVELAKYGLKPKDMAANVNFFSKVAVDDAGRLSLAEASAPGDRLTLRFEMDSLVILHTCPHPLNRSSDYPFKAVELELAMAEPLSDDDYCMKLCPENERGFRNNALYHFGLPQGES